MNMRSNGILETQRLFNKQYIMINLIAFILFLADYIATTTVPLYAHEIGGTASTAGVFMSVISLTALVVRPLLGHVMDTKTRKLVLVIGIISLGIAALFYGFAASIPMLLILAVFHGLSVSAITTAAPTVVADVTLPSRLAEGISMNGVAMNLTTAVGPIAALYLINKLNYSLTFEVAFGIVLLGLALSVSINYEKKKQKSAAKPRVNFNIKTLFEKTAFKPSIYQIFLAFGVSVIFTFIPLYGQSRGVDHIGLFFTFYAAATVIISFFTGKLVDKFGTRTVFIPGLILQMIAFLILAFANALPLIIAAAILYGIGYGASFAIVNIIGMESAPRDRKGAANATMYAAMDIGVAIGSIILGFVSTKFGFTATFIITAVMIFFDLIIFGVLHKEPFIHRPVIDDHMLS
ncbi:MAG: MFS transporter [Bacillota bacterium]|nr:MFS transporter [Bacillota bacterium]